MNNRSTVRDFMTKQLVTFTPEMNVLTAIQTLLKRKISGAPVVNEKGNITGILSEMDCMWTFLESSYYNTMGALVSDLMSPNVLTVEASMNILTVAEMFIKTHFRRFPVVENGKLIGLISRRDVLKAIANLSVTTGK